ncbi:hypothetical protein AB1Y20_008214 [Prymnesium parvum]|uniref:Hypoxanthine phosphoribosyltransferase n=1 Tax=Prymnesium parvum TaxID=97485 RepID=A0AB34IWJ2_PRYPA
MYMAAGQSGGAARLGAPRYQQCISRAMAGSSPMEVPDEQSFSLDYFCVPDHYKDDLSHLMLPHGMIIDRIERIAVDLCRDYNLNYGSGERLHMLCVLKGGHQFFSDLSEALKHLTLRGCSAPPLTFDFIRVKSYAGTETTGDVQIESLGIDLREMKGRHLLLCEDIIDTGSTMLSLIPYLESFGPKSVKVATLLTKRTPKSKGFVADYVGFSIPDQFVVGYCLDYNEVFRDMAHICVMAEAGIKRHAVAGGDENKL